MFKVGSDSVCKLLLGLVSAIGILTSVHCAEPSLSDLQSAESSCLRFHRFHLKIHFEKMKSGGALALLLVAAAAFLAVDADVVTLTDATYADKLKEQDTLWFIKFYAPWCGHCKNMAPAWEELGKALEGEAGAEIGSVDCTTEKETCTKADIRSYPTLKVFYNGEEVKKYQGGRDLESLKTFVLQEHAEAVAKVRAAEL